MKKLFAILAAAMMVVCASSCNKVAKTLAGTEWTASLTSEGEAASFLLSFDKTAFTMSINLGAMSQSVTGTYTYTFPTATMTVDGETMVATVSADYKTLSIDAEGAPTFTRKK